MEAEAEQLRLEGSRRLAAQEAAEAAAQEAAQEAERLLAQLQVMEGEKERLRSEVAALQQGASAAKRRRLAVEEAAAVAKAVTPSPGAPFDLRHGTSTSRHA